SNVAPSPPLSLSSASSFFSSFFQLSADPRDLHSFPTRRSSDLARANQLAHYLVAQGVGPDQRVGICVERSLEMVVGLLGILKARSEEHTSELQSLTNLVCRLLLEKKKNLRIYSST